MPNISRSKAIAAMSAGAIAAGFPAVVRGQSDVVRAAGVYADLFAEPFYAKSAGAFAKAGLDIEATTLVNAGAVAAAIGGGSLDMGTGDLISGVNAIVAGVPIVLIAGGGLYIQRLDATANVIGVANDSPIRTPSDLIGKSIGVPTLVGLTTACLRVWLPQHGVPDGAAHIVEMPPSSALAAVQRGTIDAALISEPFATFGKGGFRSIGAPFDAAADLSRNKQFCVSVWYASKAWFQSDPARSQRVVRAIYDTARWANAHRDETFSILVRDGKLDADRARGMQRTTFATSLTPDLVQPVLDIGLQNKIFAKALDARSLITVV